MSNSNDIDKAIDELKQIGFNVEPDLVHIQIPNAGQLMMDEINAHLSKIGCEFKNIVNKSNDGTEYRPYREVCKWLMDNEGKGLFLYGNCGLGKTMLARFILPRLIYNAHKKITHFYSMVELSNPETLNEALGYKLLSLDDVGVEEQMVSFGQRRNAFDEIMDAVEKQGKLVIITTNLNAKDIEERYGTRTLDRIKATTKRILFTAKDGNNNPISFRQ